jgi:hypothetical protein
MAKAVALSAADLAPRKLRTERHAPTGRRTLCGELVPLQFRMSPEFLRAFKQAAPDRDVKLNELLTAEFNAFMKES